MDSEDADDANRNDNGRTLLYVFERGLAKRHHDILMAHHLAHIKRTVYYCLTRIYSMNSIIIEYISSKFTPAYSSFIL
jgi:hypothetical protein